jgi:hypothetical protein
MIAGIGGVQHGNGYANKYGTVPIATGSQAMIDL